MPPFLWTNKKQNPIKGLRNSTKCWIQWNAATQYTDMLPEAPFIGTTLTCQQMQSNSAISALFTK
jgi:hypothetical protein